MIVEEPKFRDSFPLDILRDCVLAARNKQIPSTELYVLFSKENEKKSNKRSNEDSTSESAAKKLAKEKSDRKKSKRDEREKQEKMAKKLADLDNYLQPHEDAKKEMQFMMNNFDEQSYNDNKAKFIKMTESEDFKSKYMTWFGVSIASSTYQQKAYRDVAFKLMQELDEDLSEEDEDKYGTFCDALIQGVIKEIKRTLLNPKYFNVENSSANRKKFKNLGGYLGMITLADNKPILYDDLDIKSLIHEAYHKTSLCLSNIVTLTCELMTCVKDSMVFQHPNAWSNGIIAVLDEINQKYNKLKNNPNAINHIAIVVSFSIESLFKDLDITSNKTEESSSKNDSEVEKKYQPPRISKVQSRNNEYNNSFYLDSARDTADQICDIKEDKNKNLQKQMIQNQLRNQYLNNENKNISAPPGSMSKNNNLANNTNNNNRNLANNNLNARSGLNPTESNPMAAMSDLSQSQNSNKTVYYYLYSMMIQFNHNQQEQFQIAHRNPEKHAQIKSKETETIRYISQQNTTHLEFAIFNLWKNNSKNRSNLDLDNFKNQELIDIITKKYTSISQRAEMGKKVAKTSNFSPFSEIGQS